MWNQLAAVLEDFLFASRLFVAFSYTFLLHNTSLPFSTQHQPAEVQQELEEFDVKVGEPSLCSVAYGEWACTHYHLLCEFVGLIGTNWCLPITIIASYL